MPHWNYRVMLKDGQVAVHEVFYANDGSINGYTAEPVYPRAEDAEGLAEEFEQYRRALSMPVLDFTALEAEAEGRRVAEAEPGSVLSRGDS